MNIKNNITLIGRIGNDLEIKSFDEKGTYLNFSLAVDDSYYDKENDKKVERSHWINCVAKGKLAEHISKHYGKGDQIAINGKLVTRNYENKEGKTIYSTEVEIETTDITLRLKVNRSE